MRLPLPTSPSFSIIEEKVRYNFNSSSSAQNETSLLEVGANVLETPQWLYRMFDRDRRMKEVAHLLSSAKPVTLRLARRPEQSDHDFEHFKQQRLALAANRQVHPNRLAENRPLHFLCGPFLFGGSGAILPMIRIFPFL